MRRARLKRALLPLCAAVWISGQSALADVLSVDPATSIDGMLIAMGMDTEPLVTWSTRWLAEALDTAAWMMVLPLPAPVSVKS